VRAPLGLLIVFAVLGCGEPCEGTVCSRVDLRTWCSSGARCSLDGAYVVCLPRCTTDGECTDKRCDLDRIAPGSRLVVNLTSLDPARREHRALDLQLMGNPTNPYALFEPPRSDRARVEVDGVVATRDARGRFVWPHDGARSLTITLPDDGTTPIAFYADLVEPDCHDDLCPM